MLWNCRSPIKACMYVVSLSWWVFGSSSDMSTRTKMLGGRNPTMLALGKSVRRSKLQMEHVLNLGFYCVQVPKKSWPMTLSQSQVQLNILLTPNAYVVFCRQDTLWMHWVYKRLGLWDGQMMPILYVTFQSSGRHNSNHTVFLYANCSTKNGGQGLQN